FRSLRSFSNLMILNLTIADLSLAVGNVPIFVISSFANDWILGAIGCKIYAFIGSLTSYVSINTLAAIAVDKCIVIVKTLPAQRSASSKTLYMLSVFIWIYSLLWSVTPFLGFGFYILEGFDTSCTVDFLTRQTLNRTYILCIFFFHFIFPLSLISGSYSLIFIAVRRYRKEYELATNVYGENELPVRVKNENKMLANENKTARVTFIVISIFCIAWVPYATVALIAQFGDITYLTPMKAAIPCILAKFSTVLNPIIYAISQPKFRAKYIKFRFDRKAKFARNVNIYKCNFQTRSLLPNPNETRRSQPPNSRPEHIKLNKLLHGQKRL
ncbi:hypothetical protein ACJMK2_001897, partial [Sinanodonta woodiana]